MAITFKQLSIKVRLIIECVKQHLVILCNTFLFGNRHYELLHYFKFEFTPSFTKPSVVINILCRTQMRVCWNLNLCCWS